MWFSAPEIERLSFIYDSYMRWASIWNNSFNKRENLKRKDMIQDSCARTRSRSYEYFYEIRLPKTNIILISLWRTRISLMNQTIQRSSLHHSSVLHNKKKVNLISLIEWKRNRLIESHLRFLYEMSVNMK